MYDFPPENFVTIFLLRQNQFLQPCWFLTSISLWYADKIHMFCSEWRPHDYAFAQPIGAGQLEHGGTFCFSACVLLKSWNRSWNRDFSRFHPILMISPDFTYFLFFQMIQHAKHVLTHKIIWFYKSKHDFNNLERRPTREYFLWWLWRFSQSWKGHQQHSHGPTRNTYHNIRPLYYFQGIEVSSTTDGLLFFTAMIHCWVSKESWNVWV